MGGSLEDFLRRCGWGFRSSGKWRHLAV